MKPHLLLVEDEADIREVYRDALAERGYYVTAAVDGDEALAQIARAEFDVIASDLRMPGASGLDVLRAAKAASAETEVVIVTAHVSIETVTTCLQAGAADFLPKPLEPAALCASIERALDRRHQRVAAALHQASHAILAQAGSDRLPAALVDAAMRFLGADDASLMLPGTDGRLYVAYSHGLAPEIQAQIGLAIGERVAGRVAETRVPALLNEGAADDPRLGGLETFRHVRSSIVYPLVAEDRLCGVLSLNRTLAPRPFRRADIARAGLFAAQALLVLENARLTRLATASDRLASMGQVAAGVAHEINNPASYVLANVAYARDRLASTLANADDPRGALVVPRAVLEGLRDALADAHEGAERIRDIVADIGALARSDAHGDAACDLNDAIRSAVRMAGAEVRGRATLATELGDDVVVAGGVGPLSQVFINLLVNAAQAFGVDATHRAIVVASRRVGDRVVATVADTGPGIAPEHLARLFEPFFTTKRAAQGTGLGLAISREIVRRHGGELSVESAPGSGTTFTVVLPAAVSSASMASAPRSAPAAVSTRARARLLLVDDEPSILRAYERLLGREHDLTVAHGGREALAILTTRRDFDVIVCDVLMPDINGMEVYRQALALDPALRDAFVFITGSPEQREIQAFLPTVATTILSKAAAVSVLRTLIDRRVARSR